MQKNLMINMKKRQLLVGVLLLLIFLMVPVISIVQVKAIGPILIEGKDGFNLIDNSWLVYRVSKIKPRSDYTYAPPFTVGDLFIMKISEVNNSKVSGSYVNPAGWRADTIWGRIDYYNSTKRDLTKGTKLLLGAYNSSKPYISSLLTPPGKYNYFSLSYFTLILVGGPLLPPIARNFTAVNHTLIESAKTILSPGVFHHAEPSPTDIHNVSGTWSVWIDDHTANDAFKFQNIFNKRGICTIARLYFNGTADWDLVWEARLVRTDLQVLITFFLLTTTEEQRFNIWLLGTIISAVVVGVIVIAVLLLTKRLRVSIIGANPK